MNQDSRQAAWVHASAEKLSQTNDAAVWQNGQQQGLGDAEFGAGGLTWGQEQSVSGACVPCLFARAVHQLAAAAA